MKFLGKLFSDSGRLENSMWCFWAQTTEPGPRRDHPPEKGVDVVIRKAPLAHLLAQKDFLCPFNLAALCLAAQKGVLR